MKRMIFFARFIAVAATCRAQGLGSIADVVIIDRDSGAVLSPYYSHGEYWVAGRPGARYSIQIRNRLGERVMAVTSVDGVNVISGATAGWDQTGYVFSPGERYEITGWRKSDAEVAAFTFTPSPNSYAERTGRPANVGVIGVAIFRERQVQPLEPVPSIGRLSSGVPGSAASDSSQLRDSTMGAGRAAELNAAASAYAADKKSAAALPFTGAPAMPAPLQAPLARLTSPKLGTGHGEREYSYVSHTEFSRLQSQPNEVIRIRYDSLDNLFAMGIVKRPQPPAPMGNPFPASPEQSYVPDPPG
jgi:hypothetical protein